MRPPFRQLGKRRAHLLLEHCDQLVEERLLDTQLVPVTHRAANDAAQDIPTPLVGRQNAIDNKEGARANMVRNHAQ